MGAFTGSPVSAEPYASQVSANKADAYLTDLTLHVTPISYTHTAGAGTGEINLCQLPAGNIRVFPQLSRLAIADMAAGADFHLGHRAYTQPDGTVVPEDDNEWMDNVDSGTGPIAEAFWNDATLGGATAVDANYSTTGGLVIYCMIDTGNIENTDTITGFVVWARV